EEDERGDPAEEDREPQVEGDVALKLPAVTVRSPGRRTVSRLRRAVGRLLRSTVRGLRRGCVSGLRRTVHRLPGLRRRGVAAVCGAGLTGRRRRYRGAGLGLTGGRRGGRRGTGLSGLVRLSAVRLCGAGCVVR